MTISATDRELRGLAASGFTPSAPIHSRDLFAGRRPQLLKVLSTIEEPGQHAILWGERGVGKTSLANIIQASIEARAPCAKVACDSRDTFESVWKRVFEALPYVLVEQPVGFQREKEQLILSLAGATGARTERAAEVAAFLRSANTRGLVIVDEFDQLEDAGSRTAFADLIKHLSDSHPQLTVLLVGVADSVTSLIGDHVSIERCIRQIHVPRMSETELGELVDRGAAAGGVMFESDARRSVIQTSRGFPHYTHLLGKHAVLVAFDSGTRTVTVEHVDAGVRAAVEDAAASVRAEYVSATSATRSSLYREVLVAAALAPEDAAGAVWPRDLVAPLSVLVGRKVRLREFSSHLSRLCQPQRGRALERLGRKGQYGYRFRNPLLTPFVVLMGRRDRLPIDRALGSTLGILLSKSRFVAGSQCHKLLWFRTYEPDAPELRISSSVQDTLDQSNQVGRLARERFPGGRLIDLAHDDPRRAPLTRELIEAGTPVIFEATFVADHTYAAVDVLLREDSGFTLVEVKAGTEVRDKYVLDAAIQTHVVERAGLDVRRVEIMHLNRDYVHPGPADLFVREDVTTGVRALLPAITGQIRGQLAALAGPRPDVRIGPHCRTPDECPFISRCWPKEPDSVLRIQGLKYDKRFELFAAGMRSVTNLPANYKLNAVQQRQRRSWVTGGLVLEPTLSEELAAYRGRLGFLDFESVGRAVPVWPGTKPWEQIGVQFSYHEGVLGGPYTHQEFIAEPDTDPREAIARRLLEVTGNADRVLMYTSFEKTQIRSMERFNPTLAPDLERLDARLLDLAQVIRHCVYHPLFGGSLSIKDVLPVLVPGMSYKGTVRIPDGSEASARLARLLFFAGALTAAERQELREELLEYCKHDTFAMVKLLERLSELANA